MIEGGAVAIPGSDAVSQDALNASAVEPFEDVRAHAKPFQLPEGRRCRSFFMSVRVLEAEELNQIA